MPLAAAAVIDARGAPPVRTITTSFCCRTGVGPLGHVEGSASTSIVARPVNELRARRVDAAALRGPNKMCDEPFTSFLVLVARVRCAS